ncbi:hypothetical protein OTB20_02245 [Streptomyces sp. H27-H1]|uniref:hypothetical protein n=1 Tax=Streptomyces sp. H27-H1 TaxID=2996461 RepID=UPI00226FD3D8|nr:hypothetical protein [Streptomyces sp. H27-H1]MCY0925045.1 hypothetical protein [Streptomyces sp. H27-H1]
MLAETICSAVSAAGLGIAALTAYRKRFLAATRIAAYSLVPVGLVMTGVVQWAAGIVFNPTVWAGFAVLGLAWLLFMTTRAIERRGLGAGDLGAGEGEGARKRSKAAKGRPAQEAVAPAASAPSLGDGARPRSTQAAAPAEDFSDIEAILKKHGI